MKRLLALLLFSSVALAQTTVPIRAIDDAKNSIEVDTDRQIQLVGDASAPGNDKCYGTNGSGVKGWYDCAAGGGSSNSFETINAPAGTDPVAESATDTLNITASGPLTVTGTAGTDTLAFAVTAHTVDTGPSPDCTGTSQYQDGDGNCDTGFLDADGVDDDVPESGDFGAATDLNGLGEVTGGDADTAAALAANGANCAAGNYPLGVDAAGAVESCTADDDTPESGDFGAATDLNASGEVTGGDADTAAALAANGGNCTAGNYPLGVDASGAAESCTADDDTPESGDFGNAADLTSAGVLDTGAIDALTQFASSLCTGSNRILEFSGSAWQCIDTPSGGSSLDAAPAVFTASGSTNINTAAATMGLDTVTLSDGNYTLASNEIEVTAAGTYHIDYSVPVNDDGSGGASRGAVFCFVEEDQGTDTWITVTQSRGQDYARETSQGEGVNGGFLMAITAGEEIRLRCQISSSTDVSSESGQSQLSIYRVE